MTGSRTGDAPNLDVSGEHGRTQASATAIAFAADVVAETSISRAGTIGAAIGATAEAALAAHEVACGAESEARFEAALRRACSELVSALISEERRQLHKSPPRIARGLKDHATQLLSELDPLSDFDEAAVFLFVGSARINALRKTKGEKLLNQLALIFAGGARAIALVGSNSRAVESETDSDDAAEQASELITEDRTDYVDVFEQALAALRDGRSFSSDGLSGVIAWNERLLDVYRRLDGDPEHSATVARLAALLQRQERARDPRRVWLEQLAGAHATSPTEPDGLAELRTMAAGTLQRIETAELTDAELAPLSAIHRIIASAGSQDTLNELLVDAMRAGLPAALLVPPIVTTIQLGEVVEAQVGSPSADSDPRPDEHDEPGDVAATQDDLGMAETMVMAAPTASGGPARDAASDGPEPTEAVSEPPPAAALGAGEASASAHEDNRRESSNRSTAPPSPGLDPDDGAGGTAAATDDQRAPTITRETPTPVVDVSIDPPTDDRPPVDADEVIVRALLAERTSAAYWAALAGTDDLDRFTVSSLHVAALAAGLGDESSPIADELELALQHTISTDHPAPAELLYAASAMRLVLVKPFGVAAEVLREAARDLQSLCPPFAKACAFVADRSASGALGDIRISESVRRTAVLQKSRAELSRRAEIGIERWPLETQRYHPVNKIWSRWTTGSGDLRRLLELVAKGSDDAEAIAAIIDGFVVRKSLDRRIDDAYANLRSTKSDRLISTAREWLHNRVDRILSLAGEWLELLREERSANQPGQRDVASLQRDFAPIDESVTEGLDELLDGAPALAAGVCVAQASWKRLREHVLDEPREATGALSGSAALNADLAAAWELTLDPDGAPREPVTVSELTVIEQLLDRDWLSVFEERFVQGDHASTAVALDRLAREPGASAMESLSRRRADDLAARRQRLRARSDQLQVRLSRLLACGALTPLVFGREKLHVDQLDPAEALWFPAIDSDLSQLDSRLDEVAAAHRATLETRLNSTSTDARAITRLTELLDQEQFDVADELIAGLARGEPLGAADQEEDLLESFRSAIDGLTDAQSAIARLEERNADGSDVGATTTAVAELATLRSARLSTQVVMRRVRLIFTSLGLDVVQGSIKQLRGLPHIGEIQMNAAPFGASWLPPELGSSVGLDTDQSEPGQYTLLVVRGTWREKEIVEVVRSKSGKGRAVIVLSLVPVSWSRRRSLARAAREERQTFLYADAFNLMFQGLYEDRGFGRFDLWLATSLPFAWVNPYVTQGNVPPEMFVGRNEELQALLDPAGSCFVFGGRQLGKSVLLRAVRARAHVPSDGRVCVLLDLKMEGIGSRVPVDGMWEVIAVQLEELKIATPEGARDRASVIADLKRWLEADRTRQFRLLLDETDVFLEEEATSRHFENILALRNLMEETERRFKVVLAGLHSVNRFRRIPNQPLAQFGSSAPIGPLSWLDARALVEKPMRAAGFRLEPADLVHRVLVESRRHPSILQFVCRALIDHFSGKAAGRGDVPVSITAAELDQVFEQEDLRDRIRERFEWTLNLDRRYRVIALIMALRSVEEPSVAIEGLPARELWEQALAYWERGFADLARDEFDVLLDEMVNLEVLAHTAGRYRMPSARVLQLLGDEDSILDALSAEVDQDPTNAPSPERLRRALDGRENPERSPVTRGDERLLLEGDGPRVRVVFGTPATNVQQVITALRTATDELEPQATIVSSKSPLDFVKLAGQLRAGEGRQIVVGRWLVESAQDAANALRTYLSKLAGTESAQTVVAVIDHRSIAAWSDLYGRLELEFEGEVRWLSLKRWDVPQIEAWLEELGIPHAQQSPQMIADATGGWPTLLARVISESRGGDRGLDDVAAAVGNDPDQLEALIHGLELETIDGARRYLDVLRSYDEAMDAGVLAALAESDDATEAQQLLDVLWLAQAASLTGERLLALNPTVARALEAAAVEQ